MYKEVAVPKTQEVYVTNSCISSNYRLNQNKAILSLVRCKSNAERDSFLVLEMLTLQNERIIQKIYLKMKDTDERKAEIIYEEKVKLSDLYQSDCYCRTWEVSTECVEERFLPLVLQQQEKGNYNEINYFVLGKTKAAGFAAASLEESGSEERVRHLQSLHFTNTSLDNSMQYLLTKDGHNSYSWAKAMILAIGLAWRRSELENWREYPLRPSLADKPKSSCCTM